MRLNFLHLTLIMALLGTSVACSPTVASRGAALDPDKLAEIKPGATREEVASKIGSPTIISIYDDKIWYYVGRQTEQYSFLDPEVKGQEAVEVKFDDKGLVVAVDQVDLSAARDIEAVDDRTPTYGNDNTFIQQLIGNLSRPIPHTKSNR